MEAFPFAVFRLKKKGADVDVGTCLTALFSGKKEKWIHGNNSICVALS